MWVIAGVLLGLVVVASLVGFHTGPHAHLVAGALGLLAAAALVTLATQGSSTTFLWVLLAGDLTMSTGVGFLASRGLSARDGGAPQHRVLIHAGAEGVAVSDLDPAGIVRVLGEDWSAEAVNAPVRAGAAVQVVGRGGVRLKVWGEESHPALDDFDATGPGGAER